MSGFPTFGPFQVDPTRGILLRDSQTVAVGQRGIALLLALVAAQGKTVPKADLMQAGWPDTAVEEGNLTVQIAGLRKALGPGPEGQDWIVTMPRVGYRLILPQSPPGKEDEAKRPILAVLPFQNLTGEAEADYFADGIVADIITALSRFRSLAVVSRNSSFVYKGRTVDTREIASALGAGYLLEGSVRRSGDRLRITAQLVEGITGVTLWTNRFDGNLAEVFDFQDSITESVATLVAPAIEATELAQSRRRRPGSVAIYDIYLQAQTLLEDQTLVSNTEALAMLAEALTREPENAFILGQAVAALEHRFSMGWPSYGADDVEKCLEFARRGIRLADGDPHILAQCAGALVNPGTDYEAGMAVIEQAALDNPHDLQVMATAGFMALFCGDLGRAQEYFQRIMRLGHNDPNIRTALTATAAIQIMSGNYPVAVELAARSLAVNDHFEPTFWMLIAANAHLGRMDEARRWLQALTAFAPTPTVARVVASHPARYPDRFAAIVEGLRMAGIPE